MVTYNVNPPPHWVLVTYLLVFGRMFFSQIVACHGSPFVVLCFPPPFPPGDQGAEGGDTRAAGTGAPRDEHAPTDGTFRTQSATHDVCKTEPPERIHPL